METHLTIKHLAPYLPHRLKMHYHDSNEYFIEELEGLTKEGLIIGGEPVGYESYKPILRPMSDLCKYKLPAVADPKNASPAVIFFDWTVEMCYYQEYEFLFANQFDIFGLIPAGLAVDINTIQDA